MFHNFLPFHMLFTQFFVSNFTLDDFSTSYSFSFLQMMLDIVTSFKEVIYLLFNLNTIKANGHAITSVILKFMHLILQHTLVNCFIPFNELHFLLTKSLRSFSLCKNKVIPLSPLNYDS